jgi:hypothetical protein
VRSGGGKQKGASFEREVCVMLSKWVTSGSREDVFWRSAMSGGRATVAHKKHGKQLSNQVGDISCIHPQGDHFSSTFAVECKFYAKLDYEGLLTGRGKLLAFWAEINEQASRYNKLPFLVCRQNRLHPHVCLSKNGRRKLDLPDTKTTLISIPYDMYIMDVSQFIKVCKPYVI